MVTDAGTGRYTQSITDGRHLLAADEPMSVGGADAGPQAHELLLAALGACTSMTIRMYAERKRLPLHRTTVRLRHDRIHAKDCTQCDQNVGLLSRIRREIDMEGPLAIRIAVASSRSPIGAPFTAPSTRRSLSRPRRQDRTPPRRSSPAQRRRSWQGPPDSR